MTQDVRQWLNEIRSLKNQLEEAHRERDQAYKSASNWRDLYETEAKQRRTDAKLARQQLEMLQAELDHRQDRRYATDYSNATLGDLQAELQSLSVEELRQRLAQALIECDRLTQALRTERADHVQTRNSLTTALGDAVDTLSKERLKNGATTPPDSSPSSASAASEQNDNPKTPWPELPPLG
ncbi:MAG: hypothetical protein IGR76_05730 [Synechococcales cyanobacterium T60_A2020_003]|nr:hypothetical protein [Synechococcales cyanobacterium T60_A2020_003]